MLEVKSLTAHYAKRTVLKNISLSFPEKTFTAIVGKNGCGKSTLFSCINGDMGYNGQIAVFGEDLKTRSAQKKAKLISYLPQNTVCPHVTVRELCMFGRNPYINIGHRPSSYDKECVEKALAHAKLSDIADRFTDEISGGERQRAFLAMMLAQDTPFMLLDEPTSHMDAVYEDEFLRLLGSAVTHGGKTVIAVIHSLSLAVKFADRIVVIDDGNIAFEGTTEKCLSDGVLENVFGVRRCTCGKQVFFTV